MRIQVFSLMRLYLVAGCATLALLSGCTVTPDAQTVLQPGIAQASAVPFAGHLRKNGDNWSLTYVASGNMALGTLQPEKLPKAMDALLTDQPTLQGQPGWYPLDDTLVHQLSGENPGWQALARALKSVKENQADSVADYNERLAAVIAEHRQMERMAAETELPDMADWQEKAERVAADQANRIAAQLRTAMTFRWVDNTEHELLTHVSPEPPDEPVRIQVSHEGEWPTFTTPATADAILDWLPAENLAELEARAEQARPRMEKLADNHARAREENARKLEAFRKDQDPAGFRVALANRTVKPTGYRATVEAPEVEEAENQYRLSGPAVIRVEKINLGAYLQLKGVMPPGAMLRSAPGDTTEAIREISGPEIGYAVDRQAGWTRLFDQNDQPLGWVPTDKVADPQTVIDAQVQRALGDG